MGVSRATHPPEAPGEDPALPLQLLAAAASWACGHATPALPRGHITFCSVSGVSSTCHRALMTAFRAPWTILEIPYLKALHLK